MLQVLLLLSLGLVPIGDEDAPSPFSARERALIEGVDETRAAARVRELVALGPRMGGTRSGHAAAELRARVLRELGLEVSVVEDSETWCHEQESWSLVAHASLLPGELEAPPLALDRAWPYGFSPSAAGSAELSLEQAEGAAWLVERWRGRAARKAALALALVDGSTTRSGDHPRLVHLAEGDANPYPVFGIAGSEGRALRAWLAQGRRVRVEYELVARIERARPRTVIARIPAATGAPAGYLLYCAHGDSDAGGPGANDNASGEAVVLEIASAWARALAAGEPRPPRELRFALWGKEIHSSRDFLAREAEHPPLAVINFDQAGFGSGAEQLNVEPDDLRPNRALVLALVSVLKDGEGRPAFPPQWATNRSLGGTDSYVFSSSRAFREGERAAVTVFTSAWGDPAEHARTAGMPGESWRERELVRVDHDDFYHSAGDTPENTTDREPHNLGWCARVALVGGLRWLSSLEAKTPEPPKEAR